MKIGFTPKAQNALNRALYYACELGHTCVGSEHLLLGLLSEKDGVAERVLQERGITFEKTKDILIQNVGSGTPTQLTAADITCVDNVCNVSLTECIGNLIGILADFMKNVSINTVAL